MHVILAPLLVLLAVGVVGGCSPAPRVDDPVAVLGDPATGARRQLVAVERLDPPSPDDDSAWSALAGAVWRPGYRTEVRAAAFDVLLADDPVSLRRLLARRVPVIENWGALEFTCARIADAGWDDLAPALVRSWSRPAGSAPEHERPEFVALARLWGGDDQVEPRLLEMFLTTRGVAQQGLRTRCWELLHRLGRRDALIQVLAAYEPAPDDLFIADLIRGERDLGVVPHNREEILWLRTLLTPEHEAFLSETLAVLATLPPEYRRDLELRHLPVVLTAARHRPDLLERDAASLTADLDDRLRGRRFRSHQWNSVNDLADPRRPLHPWRDALTWGDLLALTLVSEALADTRVVAALFEIAERDLLDETTEYGGVLAPGPDGGFRVVEFAPGVRVHDRRFQASQPMVDAGYTSLLHFHFHAQRHANDDFAGPGEGDIAYAERLRANCLVLTYVRRDALNVDFYRHGPVVVDFGEIRRPANLAGPAE